MVVTTTVYGHNHNLNMKKTIAAKIECGCDHGHDHRLLSSYYALHTSVWSWPQPSSVVTEIHYMKCGHDHIAFVVGTMQRLRPRNL